MESSLYASCNRCFVSFLLFLILVVVEHLLVYLLENLLILFVGHIVLLPVEILHLMLVNLLLLHRVLLLPLRVKTAVLVVLVYLRVKWLGKHHLLRVLLMVTEDLLLRLHHRCRSLLLRYKIILLLLWLELTKLGLLRLLLELLLGVLSLVRRVESWHLLLLFLLLLWHLLKVFKSWPRVVQILLRCVIFKRLGIVDELSSLILLVHIVLAEAEIWDELLGFEHQFFIKTRFTLLMRRLPLIVQTPTLLPAILVLLLVVILELLVIVSLWEVFLLLIALILLLVRLIVVEIELLLFPILHNVCDQWRYQMIVVFVDFLLLF